MPEPTSSGPRIGIAGPVPFPHDGGMRGSPQSQCSWVTVVLGPRPAPAWKVPSGNVLRRVLWPDSRPYGLWNLTTGGKAGPDRVITCGAGPMDEVEWMQRRPKPEDLRVGLISWAGSYLTYEAYKSTVTATAKGLGRRQVTKQTCTGTIFPID